MKQLFKSEEDAIAWVASNIALAIKHKKKTDYVIKFVNPFTSANAHKQVVEHLGKQLYKHQQQTSMSEIPTN
jgi:ABC-type uncharacterized transport system involved in gliding motility auxiliary subunit